MFSVLQTKHPLSADTVRHRKIARLLHRHLTEILLYQMRDPRLNCVQIHHVELSRDKSQASVAVFLLNHNPSYAQIEQILTVLNKAEGAIRSLLTKRVVLRRMPKLRFRYQVPSDDVAFGTP